MNYPINFITPSVIVSLRPTVASDTLTSIPRIANILMYLVEQFGFCKQLIT